MKKLLTVLIGGVLLATGAWAQPSITGMQNNYSYILPGLPNYGIAQGSIFVIYGSGIGPVTSAITLQSFPLQKTLQGVSINVTVNGTTVQAIPYYVSSSQDAAILPSNTPVGNGTITITYNNQTSTGVAINVVPAAFGILTLNNGSGMAAAFDANYHYLGFTNAANPGDTIVLWGTGLGAAAGDETQLNSSVGNLSSAISILIGGQNANVVYHGRSTYPGLDQINVVVPGGVSGCYVSVVVQTGKYVSNTATIPVAASGRTCSDSVTGFSSDDIQKLSANPTAKLGFISLGKTTTAGMTIQGITIGGSTTDSAVAEFTQVNTAQFNGTAGLFQKASIGGCLVFSFQGQSPNMDQLLGSVKYLDAGNLTMGLPDGSSKPMTKNNIQGSIMYSLSGGGSSPTAPPSFIPTAGGHFTFTGSGGTDVQAFSAATDVKPALTWTNMSTIGSTINVNNPLNVTWTGGDPNGYVTISGMSIQQTPQLVAMFTCTAPTSAGQFTVPAAVLMSLPLSQASQGLSIPTGSLGLYAYTAMQKFTAPGVDLGYINSYSSSGEMVSWVGQ